MENYKIEFRARVEKELRAIPRKDQLRILQRISGLSSHPRPPGSKKLSGQERYRLRQDDYRILYEIHDGRLLIVIVKVGNRRDVYE